MRVVDMGKRICAGEARLIYPAKPAHQRALLVGHMIVINEDVWQSMPADIQTIIEEEAAKSQDHYVEWVIANEAAAAKRLTAAGGTIIPIGDDYLAAWKAATPDLLQQWVEELDSRGKGEEAAVVAAKWRELTAD